MALSELTYDELMKRNIHGNQDVERKKMIAERLTKLQNNSTDFVRKFGVKEYKRQLSYLTTRKAIDDNNIDINQIAPNFRYYDKLMTDGDDFKNKFGQKRYDQEYTNLTTALTSDFDTLNNAVKIKQKGGYSSKVLEASPELSRQFTYDSTDEEDQLRQILGLTPKSLDSKAAKAIIKKGKEIEQANATSTIGENATEEQKQAILGSLGLNTNAKWYEDLSGDSNVAEEELLKYIELLQRNEKGMMGNSKDDQGNYTQAAANFKTYILQSGRDPSMVTDEEIDKGTINPVRAAEVKQVRDAMIQNPDAFKDKTQQGADYLNAMLASYSPTVKNIIEGQAKQEQNAKQIQSQATANNVNYDEAIKAEENAIAQIEERFKTNMRGSQATTAKDEIEAHQAKIAELKNQKYYAQLGQKKQEIEQSATSAPDFQQKAQEAAQITSGELFNSKKNFMAMLNAKTDEEARQIQPLNVVSDKYGGVEKIRNISPEQANVLRYYYATGDEKAFDDYFNSISRELDKSFVEERQAKDTAMFDKMGVAGKVMAGVGSVMSDFASPAAYIDNLIQTGKNAITGQYEPTNLYSPAQQTTAMKQEAREYALQGTEGIGRIAGETLFSIADMATKLPLGAQGALIYMSTSAAGQATNDALQRGASPEQAALIGTVNGAVEYFTEKIPIERILKAGKMVKNATDKITLKTKLLEILKNAGAEGTQELVTEYTNTLTDMAFMGERSQYNQYIKSLVDSGMSEEEATKQANTTFFVLNPLKSGAMGAITGGILTGGNVVINSGKKGNAPKGTIPEAIASQLVPKNVQSEQAAQSDTVFSDNKPNSTVNNKDFTQQAYKENGVVEGLQPKGEVRYKAIASDEVAKLIESNPTMKKTQHLVDARDRAANYLSRNNADEIDIQGSYSKIVKDTYADIEAGNPIPAYKLMAMETLTKVARDAKMPDIEAELEAYTFMGWAQHGSDMAIRMHDLRNSPKLLQKVMEIKFNAMKNYAKGRLGDKKYNLALEIIENAERQAKIDAETLFKDGKPTNEQIAQFKEDYAQRVVDALPVSARDKFNAWRYMSMLGNPITGATNTVANTIEAGLTWIDRQFQWVYEKIGEKTGSIPKEKRQYVGGFNTFKPDSPEMKAINESAETIWQQHSQGHDKYDLSRPNQPKTTFKTPSVKDKTGIAKVGAIAENVLNRGERAAKWIVSDKLFWKAQYKSSASQIMRARGVNELTPEIRDLAIERADRATYRLSNKLTKAIARGRNKRGAAGWITTTVLPFSTAPINLAMTAADRSAVGIVKSIGQTISSEAIGIRKARNEVKNINLKIAESKKNGKVTRGLETDLKAAKQNLTDEITKAAERNVRNFGRATTGIALSAVGAMLAAKGMIVTRYSDNEEEREFAKQNGVQEYSLKIPNENGGYTYVPMNWFVTGSFPLLIGAEIYNAAAQASEKNPDILGRILEGASNAAQGSFETFSGMTMVSGASNFVGGVTESIRGRKNFLEVIGDVAYDWMIGQNIPTVISKASNTIAPETPTTQSKNWFEKKGMQTLSKLGIREDLPKSIDVWGKEQTKGLYGKNIPTEQQDFTDFLWRLGQNTIIPAKISSTDKDMVNDEIDRLIHTPGVSKGKALPTVFKGTIDNALATKIFGTEGLKLSPKETEQIKKEAGQAAYQKAQQIISSSGYKSLTDEKKAEALAKAYTDVWTFYKNKIVKTKAKERGG